MDPRDRNLFRALATFCNCQYNMKVTGSNEEEGTISTVGVLVTYVTIFNAWSEGNIKTYRNFQGGWRFANLANGLNGVLSSIAILGFVSQDEEQFANFETVVTSLRQNIVNFSSLIKDILSCIEEGLKNAQIGICHTAKPEELLIKLLMPGLLPSEIPQEAVETFNVLRTAHQTFTKLQRDFKIIVGKEIPPEISPND